MKRWPVAAVLLAHLGCGKTALKFSPDTLPDGEVGKPYRVQIDVSDNHTPIGGMNADTMPPGLELHFTREAKHAVIEGTPAKAGTYPFEVSAWCFGTNVSGQRGEHAYRIVVR